MRRVICRPLETNLDQFYDLVPEDLEQFDVLWDTSELLHYTLFRCLLLPLIRFFLILFRRFVFLSK